MHLNRIIFTDYLVGSGAYEGPRAVVYVCKSVKIMKVD